MPTSATPASSRSSGTGSNAEKKKTSTTKYQRTYADPNQKTPYQGIRRTFGFFHCLTCNIDWSSANSWANKGQDCFACLKNTYPYRQLPLLKGGKRDKNKPHPNAFCEMCKELKEPCNNKRIIHQKNINKNISGETSGSGDENKSKKNKRPRRRIRNKNKKSGAAPNEE